MYEVFLSQLAVLMESMRRQQREEERRHAPRFNAFDYLARDELGLSQVIADLLNPRGAHGQGAAFLRRFLKRLEHFDLPDGLDASQVTLEKAIVCDRRPRRLDIFIRISASQCVVIEHKRGARDGPQQLQDYGMWMRQKYQKTMLIYLSPLGQCPVKMAPPDDGSPNNHGFMIMPYASRQPDDDGRLRDDEEWDAYRLNYSLADWFGDCRLLCEADRLRWFLGDAQTCCRQVLRGGGTMPGLAGEALRDFLLSTASGVEFASTIREVWPDVRDSLCRKFLCRLFAKLRDKLRAHYSDIDGKWDYGGTERYKCTVFFYRTTWQQYTTNVHMERLGRTAICMQAQGRGPTDWGIGVASPLAEGEMDVADNARRQQLNGALADYGNSTNYWPWFESFDDGYKNWESLVENLHSDSPHYDHVMHHIVDKFMRIANVAIPIINDIEEDNE